MGDLPLGVILYLSELRYGSQLGWSFASQISWLMLRQGPIPVYIEGKDLSSLSGISLR
ncbi:hypothetical protein SAMN05428981_10777 [Bacillus sp. OV194]|nr:hypothetical protein SAMN05428981_10777 [Bacillus sp. OV194]